jgi:glycolate oxidase FAD binding subunit
MHTPLSSWCDQVRAAAEQGRVLSVQGQGSKAFHGESPRGEPLSTLEWNGVLSYEPSELVVTVRSGTALSELETLLASQGQCLPFEPPRFAGAPATVGGMVASGLAGPARASVGGVRDYVLGAELINGRGEVLRFGGQVMKNVAGYDVSRALAGSMGQLGLITEVSLKVLPVPPAQSSFVVRMKQAAALDQLQRWAGMPLPLNASTWAPVSAGSDNASADGHVARGEPTEDGYLIVRLRGALAAVQAAIPVMQSHLSATGHSAMPLDEVQAQSWWDRCRDQTDEFFTRPPAPDQALWRLSLPGTAPALALPSATLVEWHGAQRWCWAPASAALALRDLARQQGGHATLWRPSESHPEVDREVGVFMPLTPVQHRLQRALQAQFDPQGVFDTGRLGLDREPQE